MKYILGSLSIIIFICISCKTDLGSPFDKEIRSFRKNYLEDFLKDDRSPLKESDFKDLSFFIPDSTYRIITNYELTPDASPFDIKTYSDKTKEYRKFAVLSFSIKGVEEKLSIYESMKHRDMEEYKDYLFLPFTDLTNGESTYGGGRYMDLDKNDLVNGSIVIDFNKAYNPWCAYSDGYNCPVPPTENELSIHVYSGERKFEGQHKIRK